MAEIKLKAIPSPSNLPPEIQAFASPVKEAIDMLLGRVGTGADAAITRRNAGQMVGGGSTIINSGTPSSGGYTPDLTPPPAPSGLAATPGFSVINLEWDDTPYTVGHGHAYTVVYRSSDALRGNAVQIGMTPGTIYVDSVGSSAGPFYYWVRFVTYDGVMGPWNAVDGVSASTSADPEYLLDLLSGSIDESSLKTETIGGKDAFVFSTKTFAIKYGGSGYIPFIVQTTPTVINGMTIPAGVYLDTAFMRRFVAQAGQIGALAVDDAAIANVSAAKLTIGDGTVGGSLKSTYFASGVTGWKINPDGTAEFNNVLVHGTVYAESGYFKGTLIGGAATSMSSGTGLWAGYDAGQYKARLGIPGSSRLEWNDYTFTVYGADGTVLLSTGSGIPWSKIESRPTSLGGLDAAASTKLNGIQAGATVGADSTNLSVGLGTNRLFNSSVSASVHTNDGWGYWTNVVGGTGVDHGYNSTWALDGTVSRYSYLDGAGDGSRAVDLYSTGENLLPVVNGQRLEASVLLGLHRCNADVLVVFVNQDKEYLSAATVATALASSEKYGGKLLSDWNRSGGFCHVPSGAAYAYVAARHNDTLPGAYPANSYLFCDQFYLGYATEGQVELSPWAEGSRRGIESILGAQQKANAAREAAIAAAAADAEAKAVLATVTANAYADGLVTAEEARAIADAAAKADAAQAAAVVAAAADATAKMDYAAQVATWDGVSGAGKPDDNATVGATIGNNLSGTFTSENIGVYMPGAVIGNAQIDRLSANKIRILEADIDTASVSTLKIKGNAVTIPQYAETGSRQVTYQPPGNYDLLVSTPPTPYEQPAKVMAIFTLVGWPAFGNPSDNAATEGRIVWEGIGPNGDVVYLNTRDLAIGDFYKANAVSCSSTTALLEVPYGGCTWSVRFYIRIVYSGQTLNVVRTSAQLHGVMR